jgi:adenine-specific DNA-methyltransferase
MRLAVYDGAVGSEEIRALVGSLDETERVTVVAKVVLSDAEETLATLSKGSRIHKAPRDVLAHGARRARRREVALS